LISASSFVTSAFTSAGIAGLSGASLTIPSFIPPQTSVVFQVPARTSLTVFV
jgi:hypothetical protein